MRPSNARFFSAPGRVEIGGNHTDHQRGRVLAAAIGLEIAATAGANGSDIVMIHYDIFGADQVSLGNLEIDHSEKGTSASLVRGVAAWFANHGYAIGGFNARITTNIPIGAGLSSSAAYAVLIGNIFKGLFGAEISPIEIAQAGQYAENVHFGKPCGLMDQVASSYGGLNVIDFADLLRPIVTPVRAEFPGYSMCIVDTGGSHADLTADYAACGIEMKAIAAHFGKEYLRDVCAEEFYSSISALRHLGDRAILRAIHFFGEHERVLKQASALESGDTRAFMALVIESGRSSLAYLQNVYSPASPQQQGLTLALALSERVLAGVGAWRVHGGGFAGTILAFVPDGLKQEYSRQLGNVFGEARCHFLNIRDKGGGETE